MLISRWYHLGTEGAILAVSRDEQTAVLVDSGVVFPIFTVLCAADTNERLLGDRNARVEVAGATSSRRKESLRPVVVVGDMVLSVEENGNNMREEGENLLTYIEVYFT